MLIIKLIYLFPSQINEVMFFCNIFEASACEPKNILAQPKIPVSLLSMFSWLIETLLLVISRMVFYIVKI